MDRCRNMPIIDPQADRDQRSLTAAFLDYYHGDLKFGQGSTYRAM